MKKILIPFCCLIALAVFGQWYYTPSTPSGSGGAPQTPAYSAVSLASATNISSATLSTIMFDTVDVPSTNITYLTGTNTINVAGVYEVQACAYFNSSLTGQGNLFIYKNGSFFMGFQESGTWQGSFQVGGLVNCNAGDTLNVVVFQSSGSAKTINSGKQYTFFHINRIVQ